MSNKLTALQNHGGVSASPSPSSTPFTYLKGTHLRTHY